MRREAQGRAPDHPGVRAFLATGVFSIIVLIGGVALVSNARSPEPPVEAGGAASSEPRGEALSLAAESAAESERASGALLLSESLSGAVDWVRGHSSRYQATVRERAAARRALELSRVGLPALSRGDRVEVTASFYFCEPGTGRYPRGDGGGFCGLQRDETVVRPGAAACAYEYLGQQFRILGDPHGRVYTCSDTGSAVHGLHRDIWFMTNDEGWRWQKAVGRNVTIQILR